MKAVIFPGGIGTRMWPLSRIKTPKQFNPVLKNKSTFELMVDHIVSKWSIEDVFVGTNVDYVGMVKERVPSLLDDHIFKEPAMRDLGPAVGYAMFVLNKLAPDEPVAILWADDLVKKSDVFVKLLGLAEDYLKENPRQLVYIGQKPLFPDQNKGWIHRGKAIKHYNGISMYEFKDWYYRPPLELAEEYFRSGVHAVNTGYFMTTPGFIVSLYKKFAPEMYTQLETLVSTWGTSEHDEAMRKIYPLLDKISFDDLIISKTSPEDAVVMVTDLGWYGFGDWESIKEALQEQPQDVVTKGLVKHRNSTDSLIYNYTGQLVTGIGLDHMLVIVTEDAILICPKKQVPEIKKMLKEFEGTELEKYT